MSKYAEIRAKITELQKQADEVYASEKKAAIADIREKIKTYGITAAEIGLEKKAGAAKTSTAKRSVKAASAKTTSAKPARKTKAAAKTSVVQFVGPNGETWSGGRGKRPAWVNEILAAGGDMEQYRVSSVN
jgi:DNA-binding protein H-NS